MRKLITYITALLLAASCVSELEQGGTAVDSSLEGAPVTITFCVPDIPILPATKSLDTQGDITDTPYLDPDKLYVVVCGGRQSIKYIRKAKLKEGTPKTVEVPEEYYPSTEGDRNVSLYEFEVQLELYDSPRTIHFLGNVDENQLITGSYTYNSLPNLLSYENKQAYWQRLEVPRIEAEINPVTQERIQKEDGTYQASEETLEYFKYIPLIRNFAKIQVTNASESFHLHSYAVVYTPERGSVVPYRSNEAVKENRFDFNPGSGYLLSGYEKSSFEDLETGINYLGNMPSGVALNKNIPPASEFLTPSTSNGRVLLYNPEDTEQGFYIYERGIPSDEKRIDPTFIIICGYFEEDDQTYYYYRLDLMESKVVEDQTVSRYYPIYRNFRYKIQLNRISSEGVLDPEAAVNSSSVKDISADYSMRHLSDISNGTTRLVVEPFMTRTYSGPAEEGKYYELYARFFDNMTSDVPNIDQVVKVELVPMTDDSDDILILYDDDETPVPTGGYFFPVAETVGGVEGIRTIRFNTVEPLAETKTQKIRISGHKPGNHPDLRLYREVEITLQNKRPLTVTCTNPVVTSVNTPVTVDIQIPSVLPESMFPLEFIVEPEDMSLTPDTSKNINMPVASGRSIATSESAFKNTPAFYYIRTLTWDEFSKLSVGGDNKRTFSCFFKTNRDISATTIWVYNEYFYKGKASFKNQNSVTITCTDPVLGAADTPFTLALTVSSKLPKALFPETGLDFDIKLSKSCLTPKNNDLKVESVDHVIKTLTWEEYSDLPVDDGQRTFYIDFLTTIANSAAKITVTAKDFIKVEKSFKNETRSLPDNYFYVLAITDSDVQLNNTGLKFKFDDGGWLTYPQNKVMHLKAGQKISFKAGTGKNIKGWGNGAFKSTKGTFHVGGNFASLVVGDDYDTIPSGSTLKYGESVTGVTFIDFFNSQTGLLDAYDLVLPMRTLKDNAFKSMFDKCSNLVRGPAELPATALGKTCYRNMFYGCTSLEFAPKLPAASLVSGAYQRMFWGCSKLNKITMLGTNWMRDVFISDNTTWAAGVAETGDIYLHASLENAANWGTTWYTIIPAGWNLHFGPETEP